MSLFKPKITVLVTDLDNTLFDWVDIWTASFQTLIHGVQKKSKIPLGVLLDEAKSVHQTHGTAEYAFLLDELPSLRERHGKADLAKIYGDAIHESRSARKAAMQPYPSVMSTLKKIRNKGTLIVGYTESMAFYSNLRVQRMGFDGLLDYLYSPPDHDFPKNVTKSQIRRFPSSYYEFDITQHRHTPKGEVKPNPEVLAAIIEEVGGEIESTAYVGDNLVKDVWMAKRADVRDVYAEYGHAHTSEPYELLKRVTHWTDEQVAKEAETKVGDVKPSYVLKKKFSELLGMFRFRRKSDV